MGRIFNDRGNRMTPSYARKGGKRYRYYLSSALTNGHAELAGTVHRVPGRRNEAIVIDAVRKRLKENTSTTDRELIDANLDKIEVHTTQIVIKLARKGDRKISQEADKTMLYIPWKKTR